MDSDGCYIVFIRGVLKRRVLERYLYSWNMSMMIMGYVSHSARIWSWLNCCRLNLSGRWRRWCKAMDSAVHVYGESDLSVFAIALIEAIPIASHRFLLGLKRQTNKIRWLILRR